VRVGHALGLCACAALSTSLFGIGAATAATSGVVAGTGTGTGTGGVQMVHSGVTSPSSTPRCSINWHFQYTLYEPNGPIDWSWRSTVGCGNTKAEALSTRASLYRGSLLSGAAPAAACQDCASATSHRFESITSNGAGSWYEKTADVFTVPDIGRDTARGTIVWSFTGGHGSCSEVNADEVRCATTSDAVVVP